MYLTGIYDQTDNNTGVWRKNLALFSPLCWYGCGTVRGYHSEWLEERSGTDGRTEGRRGGKLASSCQVRTKGKTKAPSRTSTCIQALTPARQETPTLSNAETIDNVTSTNLSTYFGHVHHSVNVGTAWVVVLITNRSLYLRTYW